MSIVTDKLAALRSLLTDARRPEGALLLIYPPEHELDFRSAYEDLIQELRAANCEIAIIDLRTLLFELLEARGLLDRAFALDAQGSRDMHDSLSRLLFPDVVARLKAASAQSPQAILLCKHTAALYPWISYSALLSEIEGNIRNVVVLPFPGTEHGQELRFLDNKDGYNYRAARV
jgi:hypothetical protein